MPRRRVAEKRQILPDPKYKSKTVGMLVNCIMQHGKKSLAFKIVYGAFNQIATQFQGRFAETQTAESPVVSAEQMPLVVFKRGLEHMKPTLEVQARRVGGGTYQIPRPVPPARRVALALRFLKKAAITRKKSVVFTRDDKKMMMKLLALEIMDAYDSKGGAVKMCQDMHRMAKANQAYVHFRLSSKPS